MHEQKCESLKSGAGVSVVGLLVVVFCFATWWAEETPLAFSLVSLVRALMAIDGASDCL